MVEWECPTWGCHGMLISGDPPHYGQIVRCAPLPGMPEERSCRRLMRWNMINEAWTPAPEG